MEDEKATIFVNRKTGVMRVEPEKFSHFVQWLGDYIQSGCVQRVSDGRIVPFVVQFEKEDDCRHCNGTGEIYIDLSERGLTPCPVCSGGNIACPDCRIAASIRRHGPGFYCRDCGRIWPPASKPPAK